MSGIRDAKKPFRILIVDDNEGDILLLRTAFQSVGLAHNVTAFTDGEEALTYLRDAAESHPGHTFDVALLDMHLTKMDATAILAAIRGSPTLSTTPVIVLSSAISPADRALMESCGIARHLVKPADLDEFLDIGQTVREVLEEHRDRDGEESNN